MQLRRPCGLAHTEIDTPAGEQIERRHLFGHALRLIGGELNHAMPKPDVLGPLARGAEEHFRRG